MSRLLVVVDMQNDFIDGALGTEQAGKIVENVVAKIEEYKKSGDNIVFTRDTHSEDYLSTMEGKNLPVEHCIKGSHGWQITDKINTQGYRIIDKPSFGCVCLGEFVQAHSPQEVELVGLCTDICVIANAMIIKAYLPESRVIVDAACCAGVTPQSHLNALEAMKMCQVSVINL